MTDCPTMHLCPKEIFVPAMPLRQSASQYRSLGGRNLTYRLLAIPPPHSRTAANSSVRRVAGRVDTGIYLYGALNEAVCAANEELLDRSTQLRSACLKLMEQS